MSSTIGITHPIPDAQPRRAPLPRNIFWYTVLEAGASTGFIMGNWIFFWTRYMTFGQLGLVDGIAFGFGMFMEIPTGALADLFGRRRTLIAAMACVVLGTLLQATTTSLEQLMIGFLITQVGWAFRSGASEALAYDSLKEAGQEAEFARVLARVHVIGTGVFVLTTLLGSGLYLLQFRLPHFAWMGAYGISLYAALRIREPAVAHDPDKQPHTSVVAAFRSQIVDGVRQLGTPGLRPFLLLMFVISGSFTLYLDGLVQPSIGIGFGFDATAMSIITVLSGVISAATLALLPFLTRRLKDWRGLLVIAFALALGWLLAALPLGAWGIVAMLLIRLAGDLSRPWISLIVNQHIESHARATAISALTLMSKLPYVVTAFAAGQLIEAGLLWVFNLALGLLLMAALVYSVINTARHLRRI